MGLSKYLRHLLVPLIGFCIRHSIKVQDVLEAMKQLFVEAAHVELLRQGIKPSTSRISLMTGVHRKDISRLNLTGSLTAKRADLITRVVGQWLGDRRFRTAHGAPKILRFERGRGAFATLVASVSREVSPYTVSIELQRCGAAVLTSKGIKLLVQAYSPLGDLDQGFTFLNSDLNDLIMAVEENLLRDEQVPNLHITTEYDNISSSNASAIRKWFVREGQAFHKRARDFLSQFDRDINPKATSGDSCIRVSATSFSRVEELPIHEASEEE